MPNDREKIPELTNTLIAIQTKNKLKDTQMAELLDISVNTWRKLKKGQRYYGAHSIKAILRKYPDFLPLILELPDDMTVKNSKKDIEELSCDK